MFQYPKKFVSLSFALGLLYALFAGIVIISITNWHRLKDAGALGIVGFFGTVGILMVVRVFIERMIARNADRYRESTRSTDASAVRR